MGKRYASSGRPSKRFSGGSGARKVVEVAPFGPRLENRRATGRANTSNRDTKSSSTSSSLLGGDELVALFFCLC